MKRTLNPWKIKINYPSNRSDFKHIKAIEKYTFSKGLNLNKRYLEKIPFIQVPFESGYNFLLGCEPG